MAKEILDELEQISKKEGNILHLKMFNDELMHVLRGTLQRIQSLEEENRELRGMIEEDLGNRGEPQ